MTDVLSMIESMAESGHAPKDGCSLFGVGYEDAFDRVRRVYLERRFSRGGSAEKFVVGPFGSGKTHFLRQLMEVARDLGCVTAEVALSKNVDFTKRLVVYQELTKEIRPPGVAVTGMRALIDAILDKVRLSAPAPAGDKLCDAWVQGLLNAQFALPSFGRAVQRACAASLANDASEYERCLRWLEGEVTDKALAASLELPVVAKDGENLHAQRATLSLFQFIRHARLRGTVVAFDEAEQSLSVDKAKTQRILSMLQSDINAIADLAEGSALVVYALTPDLVEKMAQLPALQQRVADPGPGQGFFDGHNTYAPKIELSTNSDLAGDLSAMGRRLVDLMYEAAADRQPKLTVPIDDVRKRVEQIVADVVQREAGSSSRRTTIKRVCALLMHLYDTDVLAEPQVEAGTSESEV